MSSRLDRLFLLLENGGSDATRQAAAFQLGEVVRLHPYELETLLERLHSFIISKSWETRIAASQSVNAIVRNIVAWDPQPIKSATPEGLAKSWGDILPGHLSLEFFSIRRVLEKGSYLLGADDVQFEIDEEDGKLDPKDRAARQRLMVNQRLGLDIADAIGINTQSIFSNADLIDHVPDRENQSVKSKDSVVQIVQEEMASAGLKMSSRELNRAKRKARFLSKQKSNDPTDKGLAEEGSDRKRVKLGHVDNCSGETDDEENSLTIAEDRTLSEQETDWPLEEFAEHLSRDLFSSSWETRHGAATALREIICLQGDGAGKSTYQTAEQMEASHLSWLEDKAVRLVCVLALDRFGDFLADQVVAPVRETCAQVLGCIVQHVPERIVLAILRLLQEMLLWSDWGTRHGGLLGLKYTLAVRSDMRKELLTVVYDYIYKGLQDEMDDVVAVAATCLVPVAEDLVECLPSNTTNELIGTLWDALLDIDDLTASTSSILLLISKLLSYPKILGSFDGDLSQLIPRLWPFLYHSSCSVRTSTLNAIKTLLVNLADVKIAASDVAAPGSEKTSSATEVLNARLKVKEKSFVQTEMETSVPNESIENPDGGKVDANRGPKIEKIKTEIMDTYNHLKMEKMEITDNGPKIEKMDIDDDGSKMEIFEEKSKWVEEILEPLLTHIYQRGLLENNKENMELIIQIWDLTLRNVSLSNLLMVACRLVSSWLCLLMTGSRIPLDSNLLVLSSHSKSGDGLKKCRRPCELGESLSREDSKYFIGGPRELDDRGGSEDHVIMARCTVSKLLGNLSYYVIQPMPSVKYPADQNPVLCYVRLLTAHLNSRSGIQRYGAGLVAREWAIQHPKTECHPLLKESLLSCVVETIYYEEITWMFTKLQQEAKDFIAMLKHYKIPFDPSLSSSHILTLEQIQKLCSCDYSNAVKLRKNVAETLESRSRSIQKNVTQTSMDQIKLSITVQSIIAGALVRFRSLPDKLNPVIKPLMESIKKEANEQSQKMAAADLTFLLELCIERHPCPNSKVVKNLASFLCLDEDFTPTLSDESSNDLTAGILSLSKHPESANEKLCRRNSSSGGRGPGRPPLKSTPSTSYEISDYVFKTPKDVEKQNVTQRRGCTLALVSIVSYFGAHLEKKVPYFVNRIFDPLERPPDQHVEVVDTPQKVIYWLQLLEVVVPVLHPDLLKRVESLLSVFDSWLYHRLAGVRHMAGRVLAALASVFPSAVVCHVIDSILSNLGLLESNERRMGALECVHLTIEKLGFEIIPYIVVLIVPLLGCTSDPEECIRHLGTQCFATLIRLFPLDGGLSPLPNISPKLASRITKERIFLDRLLDPRKIENYEVPVPIHAQLRSYQQKGVNWLAFLNRYNLHGVLCDDMGLGKTLQSICILAGDHYEKEGEFRSKEKPAPGLCYRCQSLVVCPPTLTGHWYYEVAKFVSREYLDPLHYTGPPLERRRLRNIFQDHNLIIASYKIVRNEVDFFSKIKWNYIILDEGHTIKNGKTKSSKAIKELVGKHRLILTGTPIQNNVLELWSLFDFLMPGFLGTEKHFMAKYSRPIIQSKEAKSSSKEQEAGVLALEALHRQVLPFILRRLKEDVLNDLPPKITQDYYCDLSPLQERLYEDFARSRTCQTIDETLSSEEGAKSHGHIFQALQYLRRVCNHPKLVLLPSHPQYEAIAKQVKESKTLLSDISHAAKLPALKQLLLDCGIGSSEETTGPVMGPSAVVSPHRALIFCQLKGMLDIIEQDLLKVHLPTVTYLRLDGSVPPGSRHSLVQRFNLDPSIDLLLLTTQVGGLGLNLTGADTVIFVEHDWNPMRDLQAMDRAHRIGQKRVVNVYRLITKGTLEEKIMSLQKFKLMTANSVISQENSSLLSMGTDQRLVHQWNLANCIAKYGTPPNNPLLELFTLDNKGPAVNRKDENSSNRNENQVVGLRGVGFKEAIENLPELWEEDVYEEEYNLDLFLKNLKRELV